MDQQYSDRASVVTGARTAVASRTVEIAGKTVHRLGFGATRVVGPGVWGEPADRGQSVKLLRRVVELGVDFIDTASVYGPHVSEELIRDALHPYPNHVLITTKGGQVQFGPGSYATLGRPEFLRQECVLSLRRLRLDHIDLYQLHQIDPLVRFEDQIGTMKELKDEGKIAAIGLNEVTVDQIAAAREITDIASVQNQYSITDNPPRGERRSGVCAADHGADRGSRRVRPLTGDPARPGRTPLKYAKDEKLPTSSSGRAVVTAAAGERS
jgi:pyridoxine 4-dehydrogenase